MKRFLYFLLFIYLLWLVIRILYLLHRYLDLMLCYLYYKYIEKDREAELEECRFHARLTLIELIKSIFFLVLRLILINYFLL